MGGLSKKGVCGQGSDSQLWRREKRPDGVREGLGSISPQKPHGDKDPSARKVTLNAVRPYEPTGR